MTKHVYTPEKGWETRNDPEVKKEGQDVSVTIPLRLLQEEEQKEIPISELNLPFERMLNDHLVVRIDKYKKPKASRIERPQSAQGRPTKGDCLMVADNIKDVKVGDKILYSQFAGYLLNFEGIPLMRVIGYSEILSILKKDAPDLLSEGA